MINGPNLTIRLSQETRDIINALCKSEAAFPADIVRRAIQLYHAASSGGTDLDRRRQFTHEFLFLVVDKYLGQTDQQTYDALTAEAAKRVETLYARA